MADPDETIAAAPSAVTAAAGVQRSAAAQLRAAAPAALDASAAGDPACAEALRAALHALVTMARVCADGVDDLAGALARAGDAYAVSDLVAVPRTGRS